MDKGVKRYVQSGSERFFNERESIKVVRATERRVGRRCFIEKSW